ncbi:uncharacterized protein EI90DRAFT_3047163 [Cantharellus anzutake]|uniref:uncharacterized protein n=1 Tax=Cantharellus anzutake TaxID=1750568 RepID=UPI001908CEDA|nr:uncharacterized protein EI90DRAFT_3047163 [Cantharellus anzutake]KAF8335801.1 hypothetical protein EI90DRAFT_3047163 [Cantharellus anzutake]
MDSSPVALPRRLVSQKKFVNAKHSHQLSVDSPLYDASEEDNTDDGSSIGAAQWPRGSAGSSSLIQGRVGHRSRGGISGQLGYSSRLAHIQDADSGRDSPTYDGDVESTIPPSSKSQHPATSTTVRVTAAADEGESTASSISIGLNVTAPTSPVSSTYPDPPSSAVSIGTQDAEFSPVEVDEDLAISTVSTNRRSSGNANVLPVAHAPGQPSPNVQKATPRMRDVGLPQSVYTAPDSVGRPALVSSSQAETPLNTGALTPGDIRKFVQRAIAGEEHRNYKINSPPVGRPVRIYADGVYDVFHFGHALQLRQAKLSFPSVHLIVGVCSDELCAQLKSRTLMSHFERLESVRHCRWVDEVVPEAPWVLDNSFLEKHTIDYVAHDEDPYAGSGGTKDIYQFIKDQGKFLPTQRTPGISTSDVIERFVVYYRQGEFDDKLEKMGRGELRARESQHGDSRSPDDTNPVTTGLSVH